MRVVTQRQWDRAGCKAWMCVGDMDAPSLPGTGLQVLLADDSIRLQWVEEGKCRWSPKKLCIYRAQMGALFPTSSPSLLLGGH